MARGSLSCLSLLLAVVGATVTFASLNSDEDSGDNDAQASSSNATMSSSSSLIESVLSVSSEGSAFNSAVVGEMNWKCYYFLAVMVSVFIALLMQIAPMFALLAVAGVLLYLGGIIDDDHLYNGFVNNGVLAIAMLFVIVHPVVDLPVMKSMVTWILGEVPSDPKDKKKGFSKKDQRIARLKICLLCLITSPFLENTPQVAMFTPLITRHCREVGMSPSQILMPMAFSVILGNSCTLGSSSNLIISGLLGNMGLQPLGIFELAKVNLILAVPVLFYCVFAPDMFLSHRRGGSTFYVSLSVTHTSPYVGMKVKDLLSSFLSLRKDDVEKLVVVRASGTKVKEPFSRYAKLYPGDELIIAGLVETLKESSVQDADSYSNFVSMTNFQQLKEGDYGCGGSEANSSLAMGVGEQKGLLSSEGPPTPLKQQNSSSANGNRSSSITTTAAAHGDGGARMNGAGNHRSESKCSKTSDSLAEGRRTSSNGPYGGSIGGIVRQGTSGGGKYGPMDYPSTGGFSTYFTHDTTAAAVVGESEQRTRSKSGVEIQPEIVHPKFSGPGVLEANVKELIDNIFYGRTPKPSHVAAPSYEEGSHPAQSLSPGSNVHHTFSAAGSYAGKQSGKRSRKATGISSRLYPHHHDPMASTQAVLWFCKETGLMLSALKVSREGADLLNDKVAFAMAPTASTISAPQAPLFPHADSDLVSNNSELVVKEESPAPGAPQQIPHAKSVSRIGSTATQNTNGNNAASPTVVLIPESQERAESSAIAGAGGDVFGDREGDFTGYDGVVRKKTMAERHREGGGKFFNFYVPGWFPLGTPDYPGLAEELDPIRRIEIERTARERLLEEPDSVPPSRKFFRMPWFYQYLCLVAFLGVVVASMFHIHLKISCIIACIGLVVLQVMSSKELAKALPVEIYLLIAFSFPLGSGMVESGLAGVIGHKLVLSGLKGFPLLLMIGSLTLVMTNAITNQGASQVLLPIVVKVYQSHNLPHLPGVIMMATTVCCACCTPFAIPANAVVLVPGGYRAKDYIKFGLPLSLGFLFVAAALVATLYDAW